MQWFHFIYEEKDAFAEWSLPLHIARKLPRAKMHRKATLFYAPHEKKISSRSLIRESPVHMQIIAIENSQQFRNFSATTAENISHRFI